MEKDLQVKRRQKTEAGGSTSYTASLVSEDGLIRLTVKSKDVDLFQVFRKDTWVPVRIGTDAQKTLDERAEAH